jgi:carboxymethylenebutenolidase
VQKLRTAVASSEKASYVKMYPEVDHRLDTDPEVAEDAWERTLNWFDSHLR